MRQGPVSARAETSALISVRLCVRPLAAWRTSTLPSVTVSFSSEMLLASTGDDGRTDQSTVPSSATAIVTEGLTSRMSKI